MRLAVAGLPTDWELAFAGSEPEGPRVDVALSGTGLDGPSASAGPVWLQASLSRPSPLVSLALPDESTTGPDGPLHGLVVLASRCGRLVSAEAAAVEPDGTPRTFARWMDRPVDGRTRPLVSAYGESLWLPGDAGDEAAGQTGGLWVEVSEGEGPAPRPAPATQDWRDRLAAALESPETATDALATLLTELAPGPVPVRIEPLPGSALPRFLVPAPGDLVAALSPRAVEVVLAVDLSRPQEVLVPALLHAFGHVALGHVRPGDEYGHWDTAETVRAERPVRRWDREVREAFPEWFAPPVLAKCESLADCTDTEKAQLGLWRMMGEMLGEHRRLHPAAERYQGAVYQRQAAQRLVAMLQDYGGAMLCDGVGLGKTYIATTLIVHYANAWRERFADRPDAYLEDPFRVTVLAPNSVVSTWRREALPPLAAFGVPPATVRVISHTKLARVTRSSEALALGPGGAESDMEHLLLSDLVVVDEAHNFRSLAARRTKVLRDLLRLQPRTDRRRMVVLLTATPVNNSLEDLRQEVGLLFSRPLGLSAARTEDGYRRQAVKEVADRCARARSQRVGRGDLTPLLVHGDPEARFSEAIDFRDDLDFGPEVQRIGDYLREQDRRLATLQAEVRLAAQSGGRPREAGGTVRIAEELLDRIVVQRSRTLCKAIEREQGKGVELLFRPDAGVPEKLYYSDEYNDVVDVLARYLPLFDTDPGADPSRAPAWRLGLKVYMWYDVREGVKHATDTSSVVGLQRVLALKRLESSPVAFLLTLLRLLALHGYRLHQLVELCHVVGDRSRARSVEADLATLLGGVPAASLEKVWTLVVGEAPADLRRDLLRRLATAYAEARPDAEVDDVPLQLSLLAAEDEATVTEREQLERLWGLKDALLGDLATLLGVAPQLADIVFGRFGQNEWPRRFVSGGESVEWPRAAAWGLRLVTDAKLRRLVGRLLTAQRAGQRVIVFSQFKDTIAYVQSVLRATAAFSRQDWAMVVHGLEVPSLHAEELTELLATTATVTGDTEDRDDLVNAFAPYYRIGPHPPAAAGLPEPERRALVEEWVLAWQRAVQRPLRVLFATDVLAEGVNLQDTALLVNFDVHWNPVRMIQRAGRIDRRLNAAIEKARTFPDLEALAARVGKTLPDYYWHTRPSEAPVTVNLILPDELEAELQLRERIAVKTLAIDFTLGLEQGTGAEAEWMASYKYQGVTALNSFQKDRAIEQVAGYHEKLSRQFEARGIRPAWAENLNAWFRAREADAGSPLVGRALLGRRGGELERFGRYLEPLLRDGAPHWCWAERKPGDSLFDGWLVLDGRSENFPPRPRRDLPWSEGAAGPVKASHLLAAAVHLDSDSGLSALPSQEIGRPLMQGATALAAPKLGSEEDRRLVQLRDFFLLQLPTFDPERVGNPLAAARSEGVQRRPMARPCGVCGHPPGMHKCCPQCGATADGEDRIEALFGFRRMTDSRGEPYEVPQPWCRACRSSALHRGPG